MAVRTVVVEVFVLVSFFGTRDRHLHGAGANRALQKPLALVLLALSLRDSQDIGTVLAVEVLDVLLQAVAAKGLGTLETSIHLL